MTTATLSTLLVLALLGAAPPPPASEVKVQDIAVTEKPFGAAHCVTVTWTVDVKADPGAAVLMFDALCKVGGKDVKSTKGLAVAKGDKQPMKQGILSHGKPSQCEIQLSWGPVEKNAQRKLLAQACWMAATAKVEPGACKP